MKRFFHLGTHLKCAEMVNFILPGNLCKTASEIIIKKELVI